jgi:two-component system sensor histidine kinase KdpD
VLPVAIAWGLGFAVAVAIGSMLAFNFFFLPPLYAPTLADSRNWFARPRATAAARGY